MHNETFGQQLCRYRNNRDLTREDLGRKAGISGSYVAKLESGDRVPSMNVAIKLATALELVATEWQLFIETAKAERQAHRDSFDQKEHRVSRLNRLPPVPSLPAPPVGRKDPIREIRSLLRQRGKIVAITGEPAIGKTTVAKEVANQVYAEGTVVLFGDVRERQAGTREELEAFLFDALLRGAIPQNAAERLNRIRAALDRYRVLLVLDNLESAVDFGAVLAYLGQIAPPATVLLTSRRPIPDRLGDNVQLPELSPEAGPVLFARVASRPVVTDQERQLIKYICGEDCLHGHPGAIEIAASLWRSRPLAEIVRDLRHRAMETLVDPERGDLNRSMWLSIGLSYDLLAEQDPSAWALFPRLSVFRASLALPAIQGICGAPDPLPALDTLVNRSLVRFDRRRYSLHSVVREYGLVQLGEERELYERRAALYFLDYAAHHSDDLDALEEERGNLFATMDWCESNEQQLAPRLVDLLHTFMDRRGHWEERLKRTEKALEIAEILGEADEVAHLSFVLGSTYRNRGEIGRAEECFRRGLSAGPKGPDRSRLGTGRLLLATAKHEHGDQAAARDLCSQAIDAFQTPEARGLLPFAYSLMVDIEKSDGRREKARSWAELGLQTAREGGNVDEIDTALRDLARLATESGDFGDAERWIDEYEDLADETNDPRMRGRLSLMRAELALGQEDWGAAVAHFSESLPDFESRGNPTEVAVILLGVATASQNAGDLASAETYFERYARAMSKLGNLPKAAAGYRSLAAIRERLGKTREAEDALREASRLSGEDRRPADVAPGTG